MGRFRDLLAEHVGAAFARQLAFADYLDGRNWSLKLSEGTVRFGSDLVFPIQLLGSEAQDDSTWLWAWANKHIQPAPASMDAANTLRKLGDEQGIEELATPQYPLSLADGHALALLASGVIGHCCYYRGPYDGGAAFFLVQDVPASLLAPVTAERVITVITQVISQFEVDHRLMVQSFLQSQGFSASQPDVSGRIEAHRNADSISLSFDDQGRLAKIGGTIAPRTDPAKRWWEFWKS